LYIEPDVSWRVTSNLFYLADPRVPHVIAFVGPPVVVEHEDVVSWAKYDLLSISGVINGTK